MTTSVHRPLSSSSWHDREPGSSWAHCPGPPLLVLCKVAFALLIAIPMLLVLVGIFGVVVMRVGAPQRRAGDSISSRALADDSSARRSRLSLLS
jgi:hypothetical protein